MGLFTSEGTFKEAKKLSIAQICQWCPEPFAVAASTQAVAVIPTLFL